MQRLCTGSKSPQGSAKYGFVIEPLEMCFIRIGLVWTAIYRLCAWLGRLPVIIPPAVHSNLASFTGKCFFLIELAIHMHIAIHTSALYMYPVRFTCSRAGPLHWGGNWSRGICMCGSFLDRWIIYLCSRRMKNTYIWNGCADNDPICFQWSQSFL